jgi:hypothetical protein
VTRPWVKRSAKDVAESQWTGHFAGRLKENQHESRHADRPVLMMLSIVAFQSSLAAAATREQFVN